MTLMCRLKKIRFLKYIFIALPLGKKLPVNFKLFFAKITIRIR